MTNRLCRNGGTFFINSNGAGLCLHNRGKYDVDLDLQGTAIRMVMYTSRIQRLRTQLARFSAEGDARARELGMDFIVTASPASRMLSRDFQSDE